MRARPPLWSGRGQLRPLLLRMRLVNTAPERWELGWALQAGGEAQRGP